MITSNTFHTTVAHCLVMFWSVTAKCVGVTAKISGVILGVSANFGMRPIVCPLIFGEVTLNVSAKGVLEGVLGGMFGEKKTVKYVTFLGKQKPSHIRGHTEGHVSGHVSVPRVPCGVLFKLFTLWSE